MPEVPDWMIAEQHVQRALSENPRDVSFDDVQEAARVIKIAHLLSAADMQAMRQHLNTKLALRREIAMQRTAKPK